LFCGVVAPWNKVMLLRILCFAGVFILVLFKFPTFDTAASELFNSMILFSIIGFLLSTSIKITISCWYDNW